MSISIGMRPVRTRNQRNNASCHVTEIEIKALPLHEQTEIEENYKSEWEENCGDICSKT